MATPHRAPQTARFFLRRAILPTIRIFFNARSAAPLASGEQTPTVSPRGKGFWSRYRSQPKVLRPVSLTIYGCYRSRATRTIWLANELGLAFRHVPVVQIYRLPDPNAPDAPLHTGSPAFLEVNPNGRIPAISDDGFNLHESLAINFYLARKHGGPLAPANAQEEGLAVMWSLWAATECETHALNLQYHLAAYPPEKRKPELVTAALAALAGPFAVLDKTLAQGGGFVMGGRFTVADINVAEVIRYAKPGTQLFDAAPHVKAWLAACHERPAFQAMWQAREAEPA
jgi:glutathione S-transferase